MFPLLGFWPDNEVEAGACLSSAISCGRLQGGGLIEVCLLIPASCFQKCCIVLKGKTEKLYAYILNVVTGAKMTSVIVLCWRGITIRLGFILPSYQVDLAELPPAALHSHALTYLQPEASIFGVHQSEETLLFVRHCVVNRPSGVFWDTERMEYE